MGAILKRDAETPTCEGTQCGALRGAVEREPQ